MITLQDALMKSFIQYHSQKAIIADDCSITYDELFKKVGKVCSCLISRNITNDIVSLLFASSEHYIYSIVGTLFSKKIFMPLDITHPHGKILDYIMLSGSQLLMTDKKTPTSIINEMQNKNIETIYIEDIFQDYCEVNSFPNAKENDAIYIYFTSGSTGKPKMVLGKNRSLLHFVEWEKEEFNVNDNDIFAQMTSPAFDPYLRDIFTPLCSGAKIRLANRNIILVPRLFGNFLHDSQITYLHTTPSILRSLMSFDFNKDHFKRLRYMLIAGEVLAPVIVKKWYSNYSNHTVLVNLYGPTETTLAKVFARIPSDFSDTLVPVGKPINDTKLYIKNEGASLECNPGDTGEVYIETDYMSHGYYNDKNNSSFGINNNQKKWYATGDLGYIKEGALYLIGRKDDQKKIGGVRVDLNEIKNTILVYEKEKIDDCIVIYQDSLLVAFYIASTEIKLKNIREFLEFRLLPIHIPQKFIKVVCFPTTVNGKIDKNKLLIEYDNDKSKTKQINGRVFLGE
ncbi:MAG: AMP-binding protein [Eubacteriales bacterium]|nr:AMP-binding protein [Eubacteriales bacterium]